MMNHKSTFFKRRYTDVRNGMLVIFPIINAINFIIIAYKLTAIQNFISLELFAVLLIGFLLLTFALIGLLFRKHQQNTDLTMLYENNIPQIRFNLLVLQTLNQHCAFTGNDLENEIVYLQSLLKNHN